MNIILCLDDNNGMMFNKRRQSRDWIMNEKILKITENQRFLMNDYSAKLFGEGNNIIISDDFLSVAEKDDFVFVEEKVESLDKVNSVYAFYWNRVYPADVHFSFDLEREGFVLTEAQDFSGSSHEKITLKVYRRA